jgi:hypothetical protein
MASDGQRELIRVSGLFDPDYYRRHYAPLLSREEELLDHFLAVGLARGDMPSADFDPVLYRMLVPECGNGNPLAHHLSRGGRFEPPPLEDLCPGIHFGRDKALQPEGLRKGGRGGKKDGKSLPRRPRPVKSPSLPTRGAMPCKCPSPTTSSTG